MPIHAAPPLTHHIAAPKTAGFAGVNHNVHCVSLGSLKVNGQSTEKVI